MATAKERFEKLDSKRDQVVERAWQCADITIPALMPPKGNTENTELATPYQSLGARGLNNMTSKLRLSLFPPGTSFFRFELDKETQDIITAGDEKAKTKIDEGLRQLENDAIKLLETENHGVILNAALKQLICSGNVLLFMPDEGGSRIFRLPQYVVVRDPMGNWHEIVAKESVHKATLNEVTRAYTMPATTETQDDENIDVFTHITRDGDKVIWHQEINDVVVPDSNGRVMDPLDCPYIPLRWAALENEDYGRGHVEEYLGDLRSLEDLSKAIIQFAAAAAKVIFLDKPNSTTDIESIQNAESGDFVEGNVDDIGVLQVEKFHDFQVAKDVIDTLEIRLSHAFLLQSGTVRNAERVTAVEIKQLAQELEDVLGGVYTVLSQELQLPVVRRLIAQLKKRGQFPKLPKGSLKPMIVTGFEALGRGHELNKFRAFFEDGAALFGDTFMQGFDPVAFGNVLAIHHNLDISGIRKSQEQLDADAQQTMAATVMDKATAPVAASVAGVIADANKN